MRAALISAVALVMLLPAAPARAAAAADLFIDYGNAPSVLRYQGGDGQANNVQLSRRGDELLVQDVVPLAVGAGCRRDGAANRAVCNWAFTAHFVLGDNDDRFDARPASGAPPLTVEGGDGADTVFGGDGPDTIHGNPGGDQLYGMAGNDTLLSCNPIGPNNCRSDPDTDRLLGGWGNDTVTASRGDWVWGDDGEDNLTGASFIDGGRGHDRLETGFGEMFGGDGDDYLAAWGDSGVRIEAGDGGDRVDGSDGPDEIVAGPGGGHIWANGGDDTVWGGPGPDWIFGMEGNDLLMGGDGDDEVSGGQGYNDRVFGGAGRDRLSGHHTANSFTSDQIDGGPGVEYYCINANFVINCEDS
ncbi:calcium-binding protein [Actinoplanes sp. NPDC049118]|uniref:calcium-binding protein n=1 Tax=Actinoplanes sp. NPDC049118 TaxID=3155769 RepID=UPI0033E177D0